MRHEKTYAQSLGTVKAAKSLYVLAAEERALGIIMIIMIIMIIIIIIIMIIIMIIIIINRPSEMILKLVIFLLSFCSCTVHNHNAFSKCR